MGISYTGLREFMIKNRIQKKQLKAHARVSNDVISKIDKDEYMTLESLEKIAVALKEITGEKVDIGDLVKITYKS